MDLGCYAQLLRIFGQETLEEIEDRLLDRALIFAKVYLKYNKNKLPDICSSPQFCNRLAINYFNEQFQQFFNSISEKVEGLTVEEARQKVEVHFPSSEQSRQEAESAELERIALESSPLLCQNPPESRAYASSLAN